MKKLYVLIALLFSLVAYSYAQNANTSLSNLLTPVKINHSLLPRSTALLNLGIPSKKWKNLYLSGTAVTDSVTAAGIGVGIRNSPVKLHVVAGAAAPMGHPYEAAVIETNSDHKLGIYTNVSNPNNGGSAITFGYTNFKLPNARYPGYEIQHGMYANDLSTHFLRFNALQRNAAGLVIGGYINEMIMDSKGNVGINLGSGGFAVPRPSANLHVNGTIRFEDLPVGAGNVLLIDANGYIFRSGNASGRTAAADDNLTDEIASLKTEVANLKSQVNQLMALINQKNVTITEHPKKSFLIYPNPSNDVIRISPIIGSSPENKSVRLKNMAGKIIQSFSMPGNSLSIPVKNTAGGMYIVDIYRNNALVQSEKVVIK